MISKSPPTGPSPLRRDNSPACKGAPFLIFLEMTSPDFITTFDPLELLIPDIISISPELPPLLPVPIEMEPELTEVEDPVPIKTDPESASCDGEKILTNPPTLPNEPDAPLLIKIDPPLLERDSPLWMVILEPSEKAPDEIPL